MGNAMATDSVPVLVTLVDVHNPKAQDSFYFANISTGGAATKVIGRSQTLSAEVSISSIITITVYDCNEPMFNEQVARSVGVLRIPIERLAERYSSGVFQQWFNLDTTSDPKQQPNDLNTCFQEFEESYANAVQDVMAPKVCLSVIGSAFEVQRQGRQTCTIFVGEDVKTQAGPDLKALIASHKQQAAYIDSLHEAIRKLNGPSYRPANESMPSVAQDPSQYPMPMQMGQMGQVSNNNPQMVSSNIAGMGM